MNYDERLKNETCAVCGNDADDADWIGDDKYIFWCEEHVPHMPKENQIS